MWICMIQTKSCSFVIYVLEVGIWIILHYLSRKYKHKIVCPHDTLYTSILCLTWIIFSFSFSFLWCPNSAIWFQEIEKLIKFTIWNKNFSNFCKRNDKNMSGKKNHAYMLSIIVEIQINWCGFFFMCRRLMFG
jgi:hypothetical protein